MSFQTPLGKVRGLGSAKDGTKHWWHQRLSAIALTVLGLWFIISLMLHMGMGYTTARAWLSTPWNSLLMILFICTGIFHMFLGLQVIIEDYISQESYKLSFLIVLRFACLFLAVAGIFSVVKVALG